MSWLTVLTIALVIALLAVLLRGQPKGGRNVSGTRLMAVGRVVLIIGVLIAGYLMLR